MRRYITRTLALALAFALALALLPAGALADVGEIFSESKLKFKVTGENPNTVEVALYGPVADRYTGDIVIPATVTNAGKTYQVTAIGEGAFNTCVDLNSVVIPEGVKTIGANAFSECKKLRSVTIPPSVTAIGDYAFSSCEAITSVVIPGGVKTIGANAFDSCTALATVTISEGVTTIGASAFMSCAKLTNVTIPSSVTDIEPYAFQGCSSLSGITLPTGLRTLGLGAFEGTGLTQIIIPGRVEVVGQMAFWGCTALTDVTLQSGVKTIGENAFTKCAFVNIDIPNTVKTIETNAFLGCKNLRSITLPYGLKTLGEEAFEMLPGDTQLSDVTLPDTLTSIGPDAFLNCDQLTGVTLTVGGNTTVTDKGYTTGDGTEVILPNGKTVTKVVLLPGGRVVNNTGKNLEVELPDRSTITLPHGKGYPVDPGENKVTGVTQGASYTRGTRLEFTVAGAGMGNTSLIELVDTRYVPKGWEATPQKGAFPAGGPYEGVIDTGALAPGPYTLLVVFELQRYEGAAWVPVADSDERLEIDFNVVSPSGGGGGPTLYSLYVEGGTGTGSYTAGQVVTIRANDGAPFTQWVLRSGVGTIGDPYSRETTFTMGSGGAVVTALGAAPPKTGDGPALWLGLGLLLLAGGGYALARRKKA